MPAVAVGGPKARVMDPLKLAHVFWPDIRIYDKQADIIYSVWNNYETHVIAGNELGKDWVAGLIVLLFFLSRFPCRIITTSVRDDHLDVLWGEINQFIESSRCAIKKQDGGPLIVNHHEIKRWVYKYKKRRNEETGKFENTDEVIGGHVSPKCYLKGTVTDKGEGLAGHHIANVGDGIPRTLMVVDEASSSYKDVKVQSDKWANRLLAFGNAWQTTNWWREAIKGKVGSENEFIRKGGDILSDDGKTYQRRIIKIKAIDSPNVKRALRQIELGIEPDDKVIIPGVKSWSKYQRNLKYWDAEQICIGLNAEFYEGSTNFLYPQAWLELAESIGNEHQYNINRRALAIGVDCAEGGDNTSMCSIDEDGVIALESKKTPDTSKIPDMVLEFMKRWRCAPENVLFDRGGGGYQHVSLLNRMGFPVRSISFGESATMESKEKWRYFHSRTQKRIEAETKTVYKNRRAEMYGVLRDILNPVYETGFGIPSKFVALFQQMGPIPLVWQEGMLVLPPKSAKPFAKKPEDQVTLDQLIGHSPDELDSLVMATFAMTHKPNRTVVRSMI